MTTTPTSKPAYEVLRITELLRPSETQGVEKFYKHQIKTALGVIVTVDIDEKNFTPEKAKPILLKRAQTADAIKSATG